MQVEAAAGLLHVTNGDCTSTMLDESRLGGSAMPWRDALYEGPLPGVPPARQRRLRAAFLSGRGFGTEQEILASLESRDRDLMRALDEGQRVVLWFEHDLYDQLQLVQILALVSAAGSDPSALELINVGTFEGRPDFRGLGELTVGELETLWSVRRPVDAGMLALAAGAFDAVRAPAPTAIEAFLQRDSSQLPFLGAALRRLLEELPDSRTGLSRTERHLLEALAGGPRTAVEVFLAAQRAEEAPFDGDTWVFGRMQLIGAGPRALLRPAGGERWELTDDGRAVLAGEADRVALLGLDRWLGGTHLRPDNAWRWDAGAGRTVAP